MSKIDELIQQYCPNGVEYKTLGEVADYEQPTKYLVKSSNYRDDFSIPVLTAGKTFILGYTDEQTGIYYASKKPVIIFDDFTTANKWVDFDFKAKSSAMKMITSKNDEKYILKYIYYWLNTLPCDVVDGDHKRHWISDFTIKLIPVPPLPVQEEIVRILDKFTTLEAELEAELDCRKRQYEYYRSKLLSFNNLTGGGISQQVKWVKMSEIGTFTRGNGIQKKDFVESGVGCIHYGQIHTYYGTFTYKTKSFITAEYARKLKKAAKGDLIIATTSEDIEGVCKAVAWLGDEEIAVSTDAYIFHHNQNPKYISYLFQTEMFREHKKKYATGTKVIRVSGDNMGKFYFPLPPLSEQEHIVAILDRFDALVNDISIGLPAEIEARRKQYEYYRNKLLAFPEHKTAA